MLGKAVVVARCWRLEWGRSFSTGEGLGVGRVVVFYCLWVRVWIRTCSLHWSKIGLDLFEGVKRESRSSGSTRLDRLTDGEGKGG